MNKTKKKVVKKTTAKKTKKKKSVATKNRQTKSVPIKHLPKKEYASLTNNEKSIVKKMLTETPPKRQMNLRQCVSSLYKVAKACQPRTVTGTISIFLFGVFFGIGALLGSVYINKNGILLQLLTDTEILHGDGITIQVEEEIDPIFVKLHTNEVVPSDFQDIDFDDFWQVWRYIENSFVPPPKKVTDGIATKSENMLNRDALTTGAIKGLTLATEDKYTNFFLPKDANDFENEVLNGEIDGIGAYLTINEDDMLEVVKPIKNSPASQAGLRAGDLIITIDGMNSSEYNLSEAADNIRGLRGTTVILKIYRPILEKEIEVSIVRNRVEIPTVETEIRDGVFVISLSTFTKITPKAFREALQEFVAVANSGGPDRIVLDVRGNMGGILSASVYIAGLFLPENSPVLYEYKGSEKLKVYKTIKPIFRNNIKPKMTILVDGATASAGEILAAALRYYGIADIVGTKTLGKGSVQAIRPVGSNGALLKITVAHWLTPAKESIEGVGVIPDINYLEDLEALYKADPEVDIDEIALKKAIEHIKQK